MEVVRALLAAGAQADLQAKDRWTAMHAACSRGHVGVVRALLFARRRPDQSAGCGMTSLDVAPKGVHTVLERLLREGEREGVLAGASTPSKVRQGGAGS